METPKGAFGTQPAIAKNRFLLRFSHWRHRPQIVPAVLPGRPGSRPADDGLYLEKRKLFASPSNPVEARTSKMSPESCKSCNPGNFGASREVAVIPG